MAVSILVGVDPRLDLIKSINWGGGGAVTLDDSMDTG